MRKTASKNPIRRNWRRGPSFRCYGLPRRPLFYQFILYNTTDINTDQFSFRATAAISTYGAHSGDYAVAVGELVFDVELNIGIKLMKRRDSSQKS